MHRQPFVEVRAHAVATGSAFGRSATEWPDERGCPIDLHSSTVSKRRERSSRGLTPGARDLRVSKALQVIVAVVSAVLLPLQAALAENAVPLPRAAWPDSAASRLAALALIENLESDLLSHDSATLTLERWCLAHRLAVPATIRAERVLGADKPPDKEQRRLLAVADGEPVRYRRVRLACGLHVLSEADNWYVPARLTPDMNRALDTSDVAFGRAVQALEFQRRTLSAELLWHPLPDGWEMTGIPPSPGPAALVVPTEVLRHRAILTLPDGTPFSEVVETYTGEVLAFPAPVP